MQHVQSECIHSISQDAPCSAYNQDAAKACRRRTYFLGAAGATAGRGGRPAGDGLALVSSSSASLESSSESLGGSIPAVAGCRTMQSLVAAACDAALYR